jgi:hypothetical protein
MDLTLHIPDDLAESLAVSGVELSRRVLEAFALEEHKAGSIEEARCDGSLRAREVFDLGL